MDKMNTIKRPIPMPEMVGSTMLPSFSLNDKDLPAIKNWNIGKPYKLEIEVELVSLSKDEYPYQAGKPVEGRFRIKKVKDITASEEEMKAKKGYE